MAIINEVNEVLHRIRVKLYPNYLPSAEGAYLARTVSEASLNIEQVCAALKNRGGFTGDYEDLINYVKEFFDEAAYQLCDGFAVNTGYYSIHPNIGGTFNNAAEMHDHKKHPISFRFRIQNKLRRLAENIKVEVEGIADVNGWIDEFIDVEADSINHVVTSGNQFIIHGHKIKVAGDNPGVGVFFLDEEGNNPTKVTKQAENTSSKIIGIIPPTPGSPLQLEIRTQYTGSSDKFLKHSVL
ncbi:DNA-binding domain-containing protein [Treponema sp. R80B11-R83G3]